MWLGEQITERGIGNGISLLIFAGIVIGLPRGIMQISERVSAGDPMQTLGVIFLVVVISRADRIDRLCRIGAAKYRYQLCQPAGRKSDFSRTGNEFAA